MNKIVDAINWLSNFFTSMYDWLLTVVSFIVSLFDFILFAIKTIFSLLNSIF